MLDTVFPKIQEIDTWNIFLCLYKLKFNQNFELPDNSFLNCSPGVYSDVIEETFKRGIKPFFIPVIVLLSSIIILFNKDNFRYSRIKYFLFLMVFLVIVLSEVSSRYINDITSGIIFSALPILLFISGYIFLILKLREGK